MYYKIRDLIINKISGEWGEEGNSENGVKIIRTANFTNLGIINYENIVYRKVDESKVKTKKLINGDVIIEKSGGSPTQPVGRVVYFEENNHENYLCNNFTTILRPKREVIFPKYFFYQLFLNHQRGKTLRYQNKTTGIFNLKLDNYLEEKIFVPSLETQIRIATLLSKAEALVAQRKESIKLVDEFLKSTFREMFGDLGTKSKEWEEIKLVDACISSNDIKCGPFGTQLNKGEYKDRGIPLWGIPQINSEFKIPPREFVDEPKAKDLEQYSIIPGDIAMSRKGNVGKCSIYPEGYSNGIIHSDVLRIRANKKKTDPIFLLHQLKYSKRIEDQISSVSHGAVMAGINVGKLKDIIIQNPPLELQNQFSQLFKKIEAIKTNYIISLQELEHLYNSLSQKAFSGQLDLSKLIIEHILPNPKGESSNLTNLIAVPALENTSSKNKNFDEGKTKKGRTKHKDKVSWDKISSEQVAEWIKEKYTDYQFTSEMLMRFLMEEHATFPDYYSSEELKKYPSLNSLDDIKSFVFSALNGENSFLQLEQIFYNAEKENIELKLTEEDYEMLKERNKKERSGIYFSIQQ